MVPELIQPESLQIIEAYLANGSDINETALALGTTANVVASHLNKRECRVYLDNIFASAGFRNRDRMFGFLDELVNKKIEELDETGNGTSLDIVELLEKIHKMKMQELQLSIKLAEAEQKCPTVQNNTQINITGGESYNKLLDRIIKGGKRGI